jgi:hypothetical protein
MKKGEYWVYVHSMWILVDSSCIFPNENDTVPSTLGLMPRKIWDERRAVDVSEAIHRYLIARRAVPKEWVGELLQLISQKETVDETRKV